MLRRRLSEEIIEDYKDSIITLEIGYFESISLLYFIHSSSQKGIESMWIIGGKLYYFGHILMHILDLIVILVVIINIIVWKN